MITTLLAFVVALGVLIAIHEYGHYRVAVACGVKVLRFSVGLGWPIVRWRWPGNPTEFVIGALPFGGYVRMLDEREAPVDLSERHLAFNTQPLFSRALIVAAGPVANLLLAIALYSFVNWTGVEQAKAILSSPVPGSLADRMGLRSGEWVVRAEIEDETLVDIRSFEDLRWRLTQATVDQQDLKLWVAADEFGSTRTVTLPLSGWGAREIDASLLHHIGIASPWTAPLIGEMTLDGAAAEAGLQKGDRVVNIDGLPVLDGQNLRERIRAAVGPEGQRQQQNWTVERLGKRIELTVRPQPVYDGTRWIGRVGASIGGAPILTTVRFGPVDSLVQGVIRTWDVSWLSLRMMGRVLIGEASLSNLSGPLSIADYAGRSASLGVTAYLLFLALISVSLGVLNLLPLPVLDGGHLLYYLWEGLSGRPVPNDWIDRLQNCGAAILISLMAIALFNDIARLTG